MSLQKYADHIQDVVLAVFTAVIMKNAVFWDVAPCGFIMNRCFGRLCCHHLQGRINHAGEEIPTVGLTFPQPKVPMLSVPANCSQSVSYRLTLFLVRVISSTLKMDMTRSSETSVYNKPTRRHIPKDRVLHIQDVSKLHGITSGMSFACVDNKNNSYHYRSGNA
jgi:hypothetical protein